MSTTTLRRIEQSCADDDPQHPGVMMVAWVPVLLDRTYGLSTKAYCAEGATPNIRALPLLTVPSVDHVRVYRCRNAGTIPSVCRPGLKAKSPCRHGLDAWSKVSREEYPVVPGEQVEFEGNRYVVDKVYGFPGTASVVAKSVAGGLDLYISRFPIFMVTSFPIHEPPYGPWYVAAPGPEIAFREVDFPKLVEN